MFMSSCFIYLALGLLYLLTFINRCQGDSRSGEFTLARSGLHYLTKYGCSIGDCQYKFRLRLVSPLNTIQSLKRAKSYQERLNHSPPSTITLRIFLDEAWEISPINRRPTCQDVHLSRGRDHINIPLNGDWSEWKVSSLRQVMRPHVWYFVADDCSGVIVETIEALLRIKTGSVQTIRLEWESIITQESGSHFSHELLGSVSLGFFHIVCYTGILIFIIFKEIKEMKQSGRLHFMIQMLNVCLISQFFSSILHFAHLIIYSNDGIGIHIAFSLSEILSVISQILLSTVLILISRGYSLNIPTSISTRSSSTTPEKRLWVVVVCVTIFHVIMVAHDHLIADSRYRFHSADGLIGPVFTILRLTFWGTFLFFCVSTANHSHTPPGASLFLRRFALVGSLYFLSYPCVMLLTAVFVPYLQQRVLMHGLFFMQLGSLAWLSNLFLRKGDYFKVSELSKSYLPGGYLSTAGSYRLD